MSSRGKTTELPAEVLAALEAATFHMRHPGEDGAPRVVIQPAGMRGWIHGELDADRLAAAYPELTDGQLERACRYLSSLVARHLRMVRNHSQAPGRNWVHDW